MPPLRGAWNMPIHPSWNLRSQIDALLCDDESYSDFTRAALQREIERRLAGKAGAKK